MKIIVCELCEGNSFTKQGDMYVCNSCGAQFSVEDAKKMMKEVEGDAPAVVETSASSEFDKYILLARRASDSGNDADAAKYFGLAQTENPNDWESLFYGSYHTAMQTNIAGISSAATLVIGAIEPTVTLIKDNLPVGAQLEATNKLLGSCVAISTMLLNAAVNHYNGIDSSIRSKYTDELRSRAVCARTILLTVALYLDKTFGDDVKFKEVIALSYQSAILMHENNTSFIGQVDAAELKAVAKYDKDFAAPRLKRKIDSIDVAIKKASKKTVSNGCAGAVCLVIAIAFIIWAMNDRYVEEYCGVVGAIFGVIGLLAFIPFKKSKKRLAKDAAEISKLEAEKADLEALL